MKAVCVGLSLSAGCFPHRFILSGWQLCGAECPLGKHPVKCCNQPDLEQDCADLAEHLGAQTFV